MTTVDTVWTTHVTFIDRGRVQADRNFVVDGHSVATASHRDPEHEYEFVVWNAVVDGPDRTVLWDTGSNPAAGDGYWPEPLYEAFSHVDAAEHTLEQTSARGYDPADIDAVVMSHLHLDHAGGLVEFAGTDVPIYVHEEELKFAYYSAKTTEGSIAYLASDFDRDLTGYVMAYHAHNDGTRDATAPRIASRVVLPSEPVAPRRRRRSLVRRTTRANQWRQASCGQRRVEGGLERCRDRQRATGAESYSATTSSR
ncbi:MBL fold metallo-hydrolase [Haloferax sp. wsp5]|nr:MBL fold metallo-hydrolase [Haloferax sp. wsp5]